MEFFESPYIAILILFVALTIVYLLKRMGIITKIFEIRLLDSFLHAFNKILVIFMGYFIESLQWKILGIFLLLVVVTEHAIRRDKSIKNVALHILNNILLCFVVALNSMRLFTWAAFCFLLMIFIEHVITYHGTKKPEEEK